MRFQQRLLRRMRVGAMKRVARGHTPHGEEVQLARFPVQLRYRFEPVDLRFLARLVALRHKRFAALTDRLFPSLHVQPHGRFGDRRFGMFRLQTRPDAVRRVPLLAGRLPVRFQHAVDQDSHCIDLRPLPLVFLPFRWNRAGNRLPHHPPMHAVLLRQTLDRLSGRVVLPDLLK